MSAQQQTADRLLQQALTLLQQGSQHRLQTILADAHPSDIAKLLLSLPVSERERVWHCVPQSMVGEILLDFPDTLRTQLLQEMAASEVAEAIQELGEDEQADLIQDIPDRSEEILKLLDAQRRQRLEAVLYYPENVAGGIMDVDTLSVRTDVSVQVVLRYLRKLGKLPEGTNKLFVTDRSGHYQGEVLLSELVTLSPALLIEQIYDKEATSIVADTPSAEVAELFAKYDLISAAVVDERNFLLGRITVEDIVDLLRDRQQESQLKAPLGSQEDAFTSTWSSSRSRALWLGINLITALIASWVIGHFQETLVKMVALAVLMPVIASMGGIAGTQTMSLVIRAHALGQLRRGNENLLLLKEMRVGLLNGVLWAGMISSIAWFWFESVILSVIVATAIFCNLLIATLSGVLVPIILQRQNIDPAISGGVIITTVTDVIGFFCFLGLASLLI